jgi:hypothetical protein
MYKIAAIIGGVLLMAGVALAGTVSSLGSPSSPTIDQTIPAATTTTTPATARQEDRGIEQEPGEDLSGPCDEAEHANDPRCAGATTVPAADDDDVADDDANDDRRNDDRAGNSGPGSSNSGPSERSGHDGGEDDGDHSGHGHGGGDD